MPISRKLKQSFVWAIMLVFLSVLMTGILPQFKQPAKALSQDGRNRILAGGLAFCLYDGYAIEEGDTNISGDLTDYWDEHGDREVVAAGLSLDNGDGMLTCNQVLENLGPVATSLGLSGTTATEIRTSLESIIIQKVDGNVGKTLKDYAGGIDGQKFEDKAKEFANNEIAAYVNSIPLTDKDLAERLLPAVEFCFQLKPTAFISHAKHYFESKQSNGSSIYAEWLDQSWKKIAESLDLAKNNGNTSITQVQLSGIIDTGKYSTDLDDNESDRYGWNFFPAGYDLLLRDNNGTPTFKGNSGDLFKTDALTSCKDIEETYKDKIFKEYLLTGNDTEGYNLTIDGKTLKELVTTNNIEDPDLNLSEGGNVASCEAADALAWIACPFVSGLLNLSDTIFQNFIVPFLTVDPINTNTGGVYAIWSSFRTVGNILLVFGLLFIVFGQAIGGGLVDAYTAKKAMPRIFVAAILINLSIYIVAFMVDIGNILGAGIGEMITAPLFASSQEKFKLDGIVGLVTMVGLILIFAIPVMLLFYFKSKKNTKDEKASLAARLKKGALYFGFFVVVPLLLLIMSIFFTLIIRLGTILLLCVISPVALALFVMPSTDKYAKKWFDLLLKSILVYPIVVAIFAIAMVLGTLLSSSVGGIDFVGFGKGISELTDKSAVLLLTPLAPIGIFESFFNIDGTGILFSLASIIVMFAPLAMIPFAFKIAGGLMGSILNVSAKGKGGLDKLVRGDKHNPHGRFYKFGGKEGWVANRYKQASDRDTRSIGAMLRRRGKPRTKTGHLDGSGEPEPVAERTAVSDSRERLVTSRTVFGGPGFGVSATRPATPKPATPGTDGNIPPEAPAGFLDLASIGADDNQQNQPLTNRPASPVQQPSQPQAPATNDAQIHFGDPSAQQVSGNPTPDPDEDNKNNTPPYQQP